MEGERVEDKEPFQRNVNTVFQNYALFPHMTVFNNIAYGLTIKKVPKAEINERVTEMLKMVQMVLNSSIKQLNLQKKANGLTINLQ